MQLMRAYHWPGNVRELQSVVKHMLLEATGPVIVPAFLPPALQDKTAAARTTAAAPADDNLTLKTRARLEAGSNNVFADVIDQAEREVLTEVLRFTEGNLSQAARRTGHQPHHA